MLSKIRSIYAPVMVFMLVLIVMFVLYWLKSHGILSKETFDAWSAMATLSGFVFALVQYGIQTRDARIQAEQFKEQFADVQRKFNQQFIDVQEKFKDVQEALSTRYIGRFPDFVENVIRLIQKAQDEVIIFVDFPAYSCFSDPQGWNKYSFEIKQQLITGRRVTLICQGAEMRARRVLAQFPESSWENKKKNDVFMEQLRKYSNIHGQKSIETTNELFKLLEEDDKNALANLSLALRIEIDDDVPLFFWIVDNKHAIFAIPGYTDQSIEHAFETTDARLIRALLEIKEKYSRTIRGNEIS